MYLRGLGMGYLYCKLPVKVILASDDTSGLFAIYFWLANYACGSHYNKSLGFFFMEIASQFLKTDTLICIMDIRKMEKKIGS